MTSGCMEYSVHGQSLRWSRPENAGSDTIRKEEDILASGIA